MQELLVHFQPEPSVPPPTPSTLSSLATVGGQSGESLVCHGNIYVHAQTALMIVNFSKAKNFILNYTYGKMKLLEEFNFSVSFLILFLSV